PDQLDQNSFPPPRLPNLVEQPKIFRSKPDSSWRQCQRLKEISLFIAQLAQVDRRHVDRASALRTTRQLRVVVGIARLPDELEPRARLLEEVHHHRCGVDVLAQPLIADEAVGDLAQVVEN